MKFAWAVRLAKWVVKIWPRAKAAWKAWKNSAMSHQPIQTDWRLILLGFLVAGSIIYLLSGRCSGQTISQPVPQLSGNPGQLQQPQVYWVPTRAWTPVRNLLNAPPLFYWAPYTPVGAPYDAQVQPVVPYRRTW